MDVNNIILAYDADNKLMIINLEDICYISHDGVCCTLDSNDDIYTIHNVNKFQEIIHRHQVTSQFMYLHNEKNEPVLINIENIQHIFPGEITFKNNDSTSVIESVSSIYKKLQVYKNDDKAKYDNLINSKVKTANACNAASNGLLMGQSQLKLKSSDKVRIPILTKIYLTTSNFID